MNSQEKVIDISFIIPCYQSPSNLMDLCDGLVNLSKTQSLSYEIILIEDASDDNDQTWNLISNIISRIKGTKAFQLSKNQGQQKAIILGISKSAGTYVVTLDDDSQHDINIIPQMIKKLDQYDMVIAKLLSRKVNLIRKIGSTIVRHLARKIFKLKEEIYFSSFRVIKGDIARISSEFTISNPVVSFEILNITKKVTNIEVEQLARTVGDSKYKLSHLFSLFFKLIISYSNLFYNLFLQSSIICAFVSLVLAVYFLTQYFSGNITVPGYASIIVMMTVSTSVIFFGFGIISYSLSQIQKNIKRPPLTNIRKIIKN